MLTLSNRNQILVGVLLALLLAVTRGDHFASWHSLPGASWAVFFLAGVYLRPRWVLAALLAFAWTLDFTPHLFGGVDLATLIGGGQAFCVTPAYFLLWPAYAALWFAGRWYASRHRFAIATLLPLTGAALGGAMICELISSGGFYWFSGRFTDPTLVTFADRLTTYFPGYLQSLGFYLGIAVVIHALLGVIQDIKTTDKVRTV